MGEIRTEQEYDDYLFIIRQLRKFTKGSEGYELKQKMIILIQAWEQVNYPDFCKPYLCSK